MAGAGRAPKLPEQRRNHHAPRRGDWIILPTEGRKAPTLPTRGKGRGTWSPRTRRSWTRWWTDPVSTQWTEADEDLVEQLADVFEEFVRAPSASLASEIRQLRDNLGLTPKGRQDRRWRPADPNGPGDEQPATTSATQPRRGGERRARLSVVK